MHNGHYLRLLTMSVLSFISMYVLMYAMVDRFGNVYPNLNQFYMAGLMITHGSDRTCIDGGDVSQQEAEYCYRCPERIGADSFLSLDQAANCNLRYAISEIDDPSPRRSYPDVREGTH